MVGAKSIPQARHSRLNQCAGMLEPGLLDDFMDGVTFERFDGFVFCETESVVRFGKLARPVLRPLPKLATVVT